MELFNTIVIKSDDPNHAKTFHSLIFDNHFIVMVILGDTPASKTAVEKADYWADDSPRKIERKVAWIPQPNTLKNKCLDLLASFNNFQPAQYGKVLAFSLSPRWHETKHILWTTDTVDDLAIREAYLKAGRMERAIQ